MSNESFFDKVKDFITGHPEQADQGLDKAAEVVDERTGGRYSEQTAKGDDMVRERLGIPEDEATLPEPSPDPAPGDPPSVPSEPAPTPGTAPEPRTPIDPGPDAPGTAPPVPSPDPVPTSAPETIPESSPETTSTDPGARA